MRYEPFDWYETPKYYDIVYDQDTEDEARFLLDVYDKHALPPPRRRRPRALEPACGTARLLRALKARGFSVEGFDISDGMIAAASARIGAKRVSKQSMQRFKARPGVDLAFNLVSSFKYVLHDKGAEGHLHCMADALRPGGLYVLGVHESDYDDNRRKRERWVAKRGGVHVVCNVQVWPPDRDTRREKVRSRLVVTQNGRKQGYESHWVFRTYDAAELEQLMASEPRFEHVETYGFEHRLDAPHVLGGDRLDHVLVLRRR
jgi:SAM-dependent methyltransferase